MWFCYYNDNTKRQTCLNLDLIESSSFGDDDARVYPNRSTEEFFLVKGKDAVRLLKLMDQKIDNQTGVIMGNDSDD